MITASLRIPEQGGHELSTLWYESFFVAAKLDTKVVKLL